MRKFNLCVWYILCGVLATRVQAEETAVHKLLETNLGFSHQIETETMTANISLVKPSGTITNTGGANYDLKLDLKFGKMVFQGIVKGKILQDRVQYAVKTADLTVQIDILLNGRIEMTVRENESGKSHQHKFSILDGQNYLWTDQEQWRSRERGRQRSVAQARQPRLRKPCDFIDAVSRTLSK